MYGRFQVRVDGWNFLSNGCPPLHRPQGVLIDRGRRVGRSNLLWYGLEPRRGSGNNNSRHSLDRTLRVICRAVCGIEH